MMRLLMMIAAATAAFNMTHSTAQADVHAQARPNNEVNQRARELPATVVIRIDQETGEMAYAQVRERLDARSMVAFDESLFEPLDVTKSASPQSVATMAQGSWLFYFWNNLWNYPTYSYYNYNYGYSDYYSYQQSGYNYYYFGWPYYY